VPLYEPTSDTAQPQAPAPRPNYPAPRPRHPPPPPYPNYEAPPPESEASFLSGTIAVGLGVPYGVLGFGASFGFDYLQIIGGGGTTVFGGPGYAGGLRLHFLDTSHKWRPHFTAVYGTTTYYEISGSYSASGVLRGFGFYLGVDQDFGDLGGWFGTYGVGIITHEDFPSEVTNGLGYTPSTGVPIKFMVGFGYRFGGQQTANP
jgi:hypothetical protein